jgi:hypothetical protein
VLRCVCVWLGWCGGGGGGRRGASRAFAPYPRASFEPFGFRGALCEISTEQAAAVIDY